MNAPLYTTEILRLATELPEPAALDRIDGSASERSPTCGSVVMTEVQVEGGRVAALSQRVSACAFGQASAALVARGGRDKSAVEVGDALKQLQSWLAGEREDMPAWPGYEALAPARSRAGRHGAILLPLRSLLAAMEAAR